MPSEDEEEESEDEVESIFCVSSIFCIFNILYFVNILHFVNILQLENSSNSSTFKIQSFKKKKIWVDVESIGRRVRPQEASC